MRRFVDDSVDDHPEADDEKAPASWSVGLLDDCDGCDDLRVMLTVEPAGEHGRGVVAHLSADNALRLRRALAAALVGLLAEPDRLRVVAALVLGASTASDVASAAGLDLRAATTALERLAAGGLVAADPGTGGLRFVAERFKVAAQSEAKRRADATPIESFDGLAPEDASVLRNFVTDGRLRQIPASKGKRLVVLDWLAGRFEPGKIYPERDVNLMLDLAHADVAALRRYLVDEAFLERRDGFYWRAGGTFDID